MTEKVLLADDHEICRTGLKPLISQLLPKAELIEASNYGEAFRALKDNTEILLALIDLKMPGVNCLRDLQQLIIVGQDVPFVVLSASESPSDIRASFDNGALGYIVKTQPAEVILNALRLVLAGGMYVPPELIHESRPITTHRLTQRQLEVLDLLVRGDSNKTIARKLQMSESTVKAHMVAVLKALNAKNRTQAVVVAQELGLVSHADLRQANAHS